MYCEPDEILRKICQVQTLAEELPQRGGLKLRAEGVVDGLRRLLPHAPVYFALLTEKEEQHLLAVDKAGHPLPAVAALIATALAGTHPRVSCFPLPSSMSEGRRVLVAHAIASNGASRGYVGLALDESDARSATAVAQAVLTLWARTLAAQLDHVDCACHLEGLRECLARQTALADIAEVAGPLAHEFNNFLNVLLLQISVLAPRLPEDVRVALERIRQEGRAAAALIREWHGYRQRSQPPRQAVDLSAVVGEALQGLWPEERAAEFSDAREPSLAYISRLCPERPAVEGCPRDLLRLVTFLLRNAIPSSGNGRGVLCVETEVVNDKVLLRVRDSGPPLPPEVLPVLFEARMVPRAGTNALELAACASIARRFSGKLRGANGPGGTVFTLELPLLKDDRHTRGERG